MRMGLTNTRQAPNALALARARTGDEALRVVHRLDFETSGVLVFARTTPVASALCAAFRADAAGAAARVRKTYVARVRGALAGGGEWTGLAAA